MKAICIYLLDFGHTVHAAVTNHLIKGPGLGLNPVWPEYQPTETDRWERAGQSCGPRRYLDLETVVQQ